MRREPDDTPHTTIRPDVADRTACILIVDELCVRVRNLLRLKAYGDYHDQYGQMLEGEVGSRTHDLCASELRFRQMAENIRDVFFLIDADSNRIERKPVELIISRSILDRYVLALSITNFSELSQERLTPGVGRSRTDSEPPNLKHLCRLLLQLLLQQ